jgi:MoaA/NifB/PqqE/SkfB family radical SAM enzyme
MELNKIDTMKSLIEPLPPFKMSDRCKINTGYLCNGNCYFCYYEESRDHNFKTETIKHQLDIGIRHGLTACDFTGGEPTMHEYFLEVVDYARYLGYKTICAISNGTTFCDRSFLKEAIDAGLTEILLSLHGPEEVQNEIMQMGNAYQKMIKTIQNASALGLRTRVNSVITTRTCKTLPNVAAILNNYPIVNYNMIMFKYCYDQSVASLDKTLPHEVTTGYVKEAIDISNIPYINARYIPFCLMRGYEKYVSNYPQKKYDPLEWLNTLVYRFCLPEKEVLNLCLDFLELDKETEVNKSIRSTCTTSYMKPYECIRCQEFLICDGFEKEYAKLIDVRSEAKPQHEEKIKDPMHYRYKYYEGVCDE